MGNESLAHKELKRQAKEKLRSMGFKDNEIFEEYPINGKPRGFIIDVAGISENKKIAIECGQLDKLKGAVLKGEIGNTDLKFDELIHLPYSEVLRSEIYEFSPELKERKKYLVAVYNEEVYLKLNKDEEFRFEKCEGIDDLKFKMGRFAPWMIIPTATGASGSRLMYEINFAISYTKPDFEVSMGSETNLAVQQFIDQMALKDNQLKLLELFKKLPDICVIQVGYKFRDKKHRAPPLPRNWEDTQPHKCNTLSDKELEEMMEYLDFYLRNGAKFEEYPIITIVDAIVKKEELGSLFKILKPIYNLLFNLDTFDYRRAKEIKQIPSFEWYVDGGQYELLLEKVQKQFPEIDKSKLKKLIKLIKKEEGNNPKR